MLASQNRKKVRLAAFLLTVAATFALFFVLNEMTGFVADDFLYFFKYTGHSVKGEVQRLTGLRDIIEGMKTHYMVCNGRIPAHFWLQVFTLFDKTAFNIVNSIMFAAIGVLIYFHAVVDPKELNPALLIFIYSFLWMGIHFAGTVYFWYSGAFNYLWTATLVLAFLLFYRYNAHGDKKPTAKREILLCLATAVLGFFSGWTNENMGCAVIIATVLFMIYGRIKREKFMLHRIIGMIGSAAGSLMLLLAPANNVRFNNSKREKNIFEHLPWSIEQIYVGIWRACLLLLVIAVVALIVCRVKKLRLNWLLPAVYVITGLASAGAMVLSPEAPSRAFFGANVLIICGAFSILSQLISFGIKGVSKTVAVAAVAVGIAFAALYTADFFGFKADREMYIQTEQYIEERRDAGEKIIYLPREKTRKYWLSLHYCLDGVINRGKENKWVLSWAAQYYGVDAIKVSSPDDIKAHNNEQPKPKGEHNHEQKKNY